MELKVPSGEFSFQELSAVADAVDVGARFADAGAVGFADAVDAGFADALVAGFADALVAGAAGFADVGAVGFADAFVAGASSRAPAMTVVISRII